MQNQQNVQDIKAVFVDLDGTLLRTVDSVSPRTITAFRKLKEKGITPVIATGRPACESDFAIRAIGADGLLIVMNGLEIYENYASRRLLFESYMTGEQTECLISWLLENQIFFEAFIGEQSYCQTDNHKLIYGCGMNREQAHFFANIVKVKDDILAYVRENHLHVNKALVSVADTSLIPALRRHFETIPGIQTLSSGPHYIEVLPVGMDKGLAVRKVCEAAGFKKSQVMAIGDSENDIGMFTEAGFRVAMGNAYPELKAIADVIAPVCAEDGAAWAAEQLLSALHT